jgi:hypothetical protein
MKKKRILIDLHSFEIVSKSFEFYRNAPYFSTRYIKIDFYFLSTLVPGLLNTWSDFFDLFFN